MMLEIVVSLIIGMGLLTFGLSLCVHARRVDFYTNQETYTRFAISDGLRWPYTFVRVLRDFIKCVR